MSAKQRLAEAFLAAGYDTEVEAPVLSEGGDRRADVLLTNKRGARAAIEVQHSSIDEATIERRT
jgi:competence CoiA-like predicted nuclease